MSDTPLSPPVPRAEGPPRRRGRAAGLARAEAIQRQDRLPAAAGRTGRRAGRREPGRRLGVRLGGGPASHAGVGAEGRRRGEGGQPLADRRGDPGAGRRGHRRGGGVPHHAEGARRRLPDGSPPSVAALAAPAGRAARSRRSLLRDPRVLPRARLRADRFAHPDTGGLRGDVDSSSPPTTSATKPSWRSRDSCISSRRRQHSARSTASDPRSGPRSRRPVATSRSSGWSSRRSRSSSWTGLRDLAEDFVCTLIARVLDRCREDLEVLERDVAMLERIVPPFPPGSATPRRSRSSRARA